MGVPAFFRWLSVKYPSIVVEVREENAVYVNGVKVYADASKPNPNGIEFDNLYLDMNGIIHPCTHPEDRPPPQTEAEMMLAIFDYLDRLFAIVRPRKLVYMAVDGVAPRAKMNQQRSRRFRAAKEATEKEVELTKLREEKLAEGAILPPPPDPSMRFDSNCITPGTEFMSRLTEWLVFYVHQRMSEDPAWRSMMVFLSDASVPGEGEHKIMDFIRRQRATPDYDAETAHCLCGADADLIMLGLATHEPNFTIIREEFVPNKPRPCELCSQFGHDTKECTGTARSSGDGGAASKDEDDEQAQNAVVSSTRFIYIRLNVLREYLERELEMQNCKLRFEYSFERVLDDFVFLCFFVGNDFLPHLPSLEIREGAIDRLVRIYKETLPSCDGYLTHDGHVHIEHVEPLLRTLGEQEDAIFRKRRDDELHQRRREHFRKAREANSYWNRVARNDPSIALPPFVRDSQRGHNFRGGAGQPGFDRFSHEYLGRDRDRAPNPNAPVETSNQDAANQLRQQLGGKKRKLEDETASADGDGLKKARAEPDSTTPNEAGETEEKDPDEQDAVRLWEDGWKERYYSSKFDVDVKDNPNFPKMVAREYARGLCWVLLYYYQGVPSWKWFYPYHYAPFASDFAGLRPSESETPAPECPADNPNPDAVRKDNDLLTVVTCFEHGTRPFRPLEQLMGVFPAASRRFLPPSWQRLMFEEDSPVLDLYPTDFRIDLNGKRQAWQGVALLPFVDENRLFGALEALQNDLTPAESYRNREGDDIIFVSKHHPGFALLQSLYQSGESRIEESLNPKLFSGLSGIVKRWPDAYPFDAPIRFDREGYNDAVQRNCALAALYNGPTYPLGFIFPAKLLERATLLPRTLKPADFESLQNAMQFGFGQNQRRFNRRGDSFTPFRGRGRGAPYQDASWQPVIGFGNAGRPNNDPQTAQRMISHAHGGRPPRPQHHSHGGNAPDYYGGHHAPYRAPYRGGYHHSQPPFGSSDFHPPFEHDRNYERDRDRHTYYGDHRSRSDAPPRDNAYSRSESAPPRRDRNHYSYDAPRDAPHHQHQQSAYPPREHRFAAPHHAHNNRPPFDPAPHAPLAWNRMMAQQPPAPNAYDNTQANSFGSGRPPSFVPGYRRY